MKEDVMVEHAGADELRSLAGQEQHAAPETLARKVGRGEVMVARAGGEVVGWLSVMLL